MKLEKGGVTVPAVRAPPGSGWQRVWELMTVRRPANFQRDGNCRVGGALHGREASTWLDRRRDDTPACASVLNPQGSDALVDPEDATIDRSIDGSPDNPTPVVASPTDPSTHVHTHAHVHTQGRWKEAQQHANGSRTKSRPPPAAGSIEDGGPGGPRRARSGSGIGVGLAGGGGWERGRAAVGEAAHRAALACTCIHSTALFIDRPGANATVILSPYRSTGGECTCNSQSIHPSN